MNKSKFLAYNKQQKREGTFNFEYKQSSASKATLSNSVYVSLHYNPMMHTCGVSKVDFALRKNFTPTGNVKNQLIHAFSCASSSYMYDALVKCGEHSRS